MRRLGFCIFIFLAAGFFAAAQAEEVIQNFDVVIDVEENGDFLVTETIEVNVEGRQIRRGIFRELPRYRMYGEQRVPVRYDLKSVTRNGKKEPYETSNVGNALNIRIGDADVFLPYEVHRYAISYEIKDEIRRDDSFDEVYWNVTGNYWAFPIENASVRVNMPDGAQLLRHDVFTGSLGSTEKAASFFQDGGADGYRTTARLAPREGMTVSFQYEKGVIAAQQESTARFLWWVRHGALVLITLSFLGIFGYYFLRWNAVGRDPAKDPVFARYAPPKGYSAAAVSRIHFKGFRGHNALIATLIGLGTKKYLKIDTDKKKTVLTRLDPPAHAPRLNKEESILLNRLLSGGAGDQITLKKKYNASFYKAYQKLRKQLSQSYGDPYFKANVGWIILGIILSVAAIITSLTQLYGSSSPYFWWVFFAIIGMNVVFLFLMPAPTKKGQKISAEIEGFKLYLKTAEKQKLDAVEVGSDRPPPMSVEHYEKMLPYAIALGVEKPWTKYFEKSMPVEADNYNPGYTSMSRGSYKNLSSLTNSMVSNLSSGVSSAQPSSSGSSSSSGGGFSGGGGGGGGGGGW